MQCLQSSKNWHFECIEQHYCLCEWPLHPIRLHIQNAISVWTNLHWWFGQHITALPEYFAFSFHSIYRIEFCVYIFHMTTLFKCVQSESKQMHIKMESMHMALCSGCVKSVHRNTTFSECEWTCRIFGIAYHFYEDYMQACIISNARICMQLPAMVSPSHVYLLHFANILPSIHRLN